MEIEVADDGRVVWRCEGVEASRLIADLLDAGYTLEEVQRGLDRALNDPVTEPLSTTGPLAAVSGHNWHA